jgi:hypothetical protein
MKKPAERVMHGAMVRRRPFLYRRGADRVLSRLRTFSIAGRRRIERDLPRNFRADRNVSADLGLKGKSCLLSEWKPGAIGLAIVDELSAFGIPAGDIETVLVEIDPVNWGLGGVPASELDFKIDA